MDDDVGELDTAIGPSAAENGAAASDPIKAAIRSRLFPGRAPTARIGRFAILDVLGEGGMGTVLTAYDDQLDRRVALKLIKGSATEEARGRMLREAQAMARLTHPNVVTVYDVGEHAGELFVAMEYVRGQTLRDWQDEPGRPLSKIVAKYVQAGEGLAAAHAKGLVHRDFKPHNAMVDSEGRVRVLDFGLASRRDEKVSALTESTVLPSPVHGALDTPLTEAGSVMGTPVYMSPEQFMGGTVDARSDQYSFCVALWEALHGNRPFTGKDPPSLFTAIAQQDFSEPVRPGVPLPLADILRRGLQAKAEDRWPDFSSLLDALSAFADASPPSVSMTRRLTYGVFAVFAYGALLYGLGAAWGGELMFFGSETVVEDDFAAAIVIWGTINSPIHFVLWRVASKLGSQTPPDSALSWGHEFQRSWITRGWLALVALLALGIGVRAGATPVRVGLAVLPIVCIPVIAIWLARGLVAARGRVLWSAMLGTTAAATAWVLGEGVSGLGLSLIYLHLGAVVALVASGLSVGCDGRSIPRRLAVPGLLVAIAIPIALSLGLRGFDDVPSVRPRTTIRPAPPGLSLAGVDDCVCPGCVQGTLGSAPADADVHRFELEALGLHALHLEVIPSTAALEVAEPTRIFETRPPSIIGPGRLDLVIRRPRRVWSFNSTSYCLAVRLEPLPPASELALTSSDSAHIATVEWRRNGDRWETSANGTADAPLLMLRLPSPLVIDTPGPLPFESARVADTDVVLDAVRKTGDGPEKVALTNVPVENGRWTATLRLEDTDRPGPNAPDHFTSIIFVEAPQSTTVEGH